MVRRLMLFCAILGAAAPVAYATDLICPDGNATVSAADRATAEHACAVTEAAISRLLSCQMAQTEPVRIELVEDLEGANPACVGRFLCHDGKIELLSPAALVAALSPDSAYAPLPPAAVFDAFLVHELTHALIYQTLGGIAGSVAQNEYIAYAMQLDSMPPPVREILVAPYRTQRDVTLDEFNNLMLGFAPDRFAARAWLHFSRPENGCKFVGLILNGTVSFGDFVP